MGVQLLQSFDFIDFVSIREADLSGAHLSGADLDDADLGSANLIGANFIGADLSRALQLHLLPQH